MFLYWLLFILMLVNGFLLLDFKCVVINFKVCIICLSCFLFFLLICIVFCFLVCVGLYWFWMFCFDWCLIAFMCCFVSDSCFYGFSIVLGIGLFFDWFWSAYYCFCLRFVIVFNCCYWFFKGLIFIFGLTGFTVFHCLFTGCLSFLLFCVLVSMFWLWRLVVFFFVYVMF